jgi:hypothetical protein
MARLVVPRHPGSARFASADNVKDLPPDTYTDRLVKYIPAETITFFTFVDKFLINHYGLDAAGNATKVPADTMMFTLSAGFFLLGLAGTPIYLYKQRLRDQPWGLHALLATVGFAVWAYTLGGSMFVINHWHNVLLAGVLAPVFTFVAAWFPPNPK